MPKSKRDAWEERRARREAGDPMAQNDFLYHRAKVNHVDKYGVRYSLPGNIKVRSKIKVVFTMPTDEQQLVGCDGCTMKHSDANLKCGANGGTRVVSPGMRFAFPAAGSVVYLVPLVRNLKRRTYIIYKVRVLGYYTEGKRRAGHASIEVVATGSRTYKSR